MGTLVVTPDEYDDRAEWPRYWRAIRFVAVSLLVAIVIIGGATYLPRPDSFPLRIVMELLIGGIAVAMSTGLARRLEQRRERRSA